MLSLTRMLQAADADDAVGATNWIDAIKAGIETEPGSTAVENRMAGPDVSTGSNPVYITSWRRLSKAPGGRAVHNERE